jgi:hypothetical protein
VGPAADSLVAGLGLPIAFIWVEKARGENAMMGLFGSSSFIGLTLLALLLIGRTGCSFPMSFSKLPGIPARPRAAALLPLPWCCACLSDGRPLRTLRTTPEAKFLYDFGCVTTMDIVELIYRPSDPQGPSKDYEFSRITMRRRWEQGLSDTQTTLVASPWLAQMPPEVGARTFDVLKESPHSADPNNEAPDR